MNNELEEILITYKHELALPSDVADTFANTCTGMLLVLSTVAEHFIGERLFSLTQKSHFLQHISLLARYLNPRLTWCFMGEDMQRKLSHLGKACVSGQRPGQTIGKMMLRYRVGLHLLFEELQKAEGWMKKKLTRALLACFFAVVLISMSVCQAGYCQNWETTKCSWEIYHERFTVRVYLER